MDEKLAEQLRGLTFEKLRELRSSRHIKVHGKNKEELMEALKPNRGSEFGGHYTNCSYWSRGWQCRRTYWTTDEDDAVNAGGAASMDGYAGEMTR